MLAVGPLGPQCSSKRVIISGTEICFEIPEFLRQPSKTICENGNSNHDEPNKLETF